MRIPTQLRSNELGFNMTPMIDVVFLLIIFFLVSSHLAKQEAQMELPLPEAASGTDSLASPQRRITLNVLPDGELLLAGRRLSQSQLEARLSDAMADASSELEVRIRSDRNVPFRHIEPLMLACARAGIWNVTFGVFRREGN